MTESAVCARARAPLAGVGWRCVCVRAMPRFCLALLASATVASATAPSPPHDSLTLSEDCVVLTISPTAGPMLGGTLVNLTGTRLGDGAAWRCSFGTSIVGAEYFEDAERVGCLSPSSDVAASVPTNVSIDGGSSFCSGEPQPYQYYAPPNVSAISPASGSTEGGTVVTVLGSGFSALTSDRVVCTFGRLRIGDAYRAGAVVGTVGNVSDGLIECIAPTANAADAVGSAAAPLLLEEEEAMAGAASGVPAAASALANLCDRSSVSTR